MNCYFDLHTHTIASGHAYSTLAENAAYAASIGFKAYGFSDHNAGLPGAPDNIYFSNFKIIPRIMNGILVLRGAEVNIMDYEGHYDLKPRWSAGLDYIIASLHNYAYIPGTIEENTSAVLGAIADPYVRVIGHPDDSRFPIDFETVVKAASENGVLIELNNSSLLPTTSRKNCVENDIEILKLCRKYETRVLLSSDAHICSTVGEFEAAKKLISEVEFPDDLICNNSLQKLKWVIAPDHYQDISTYIE